MTTRRRQASVCATQASNGTAWLRCSTAGDERTQGTRKIVVNGGDGLTWPRNARSLKVIATSQSLHLPVIHNQLWPSRHIPPETLKTAISNVVSLTRLMLAFRNK